ncbi:hypothetical protein SNARM312S_06458 [Streptomyces narbonensis]
MAEISNGAVGDLRHLQGEELLHQIGVRAREGDGRTADTAGHPDDVRTQPQTVRVVLARHLLLHREDGLQLVVQPDAAPFTVAATAGAVRLAAVLEDRVAGVYSDLVRAGRGPLRSEAAAALREAAVRAVRWRGSDVTFPGLAERV